jgi:hypothetical protein
VHRLELLRRGRKDLVDLVMTRLRHGPVRTDQPT